MTDETIQQIADRIVRQDVCACASTLVSDLAAMKDEQANELCAPVPAYDEAALQEGWKQDPDDGTWSHVDYPGDTYDTAAELCDAQRIEPYEREVFEHWIVSDYLARQLAELGEKTDSDFHGLTIWARTTTGQSIAIDSCILAIAENILRRNRAASTIAERV